MAKGTRQEVYDMYPTWQIVDGWKYRSMTDGFKLVLSYNKRNDKLVKTFLRWKNVEVNGKENTIIHNLQNNSVIVVDSVVIDVRINLTWVVVKSRFTPYQNCRVVTTFNSNQYAIPKLTVRVKRIPLMEDIKLAWRYLTNKLNG